MNTSSRDCIFRDILNCASKLMYRDRTIRHMSWKPHFASKQALIFCSDNFLLFPLIKTKTVHQY